MYGRMGVNAKKQMDFVRRRVRRPKLTNRNYYIYSYDGEKSYYIDEDEYYNDGLYSNNKEEWDEYPELEEVDEKDFCETCSDDDEEIWERYDGNPDNISDQYCDDEENCCDDEDCCCNDDDCCDYEITIDPKKALLFSAGILAGVVTIACLIRKRR